MYAVIKTGGKQYRVANGDIIAVEKLAGDPGSTVALAPVLMLDDDKSSTVGTPVVEGAAVSAEILEQTRGDKIIVFKKKRRKGYRRKMGHRQDVTVVRITDVTGKAKAGPKRATKGAAKPPAEEKPAVDEAVAEAAPAEEGKSAAAKPAAKRTTTRKPAAKKAAPKKPAAKKPAAKKPAAKSTTGKNSTTAKKPAAKKPAAKRTTTRSKSSGAAKGADKE